MTLNRYARILASVFTAVALVGLLSLPARAAGTLQTIASFASGPEKLGVYTYAEGPDVIGLIGISTPSVKYSSAFSKSDLTALIPLWEKTENLNGDTYVIAGSLRETGTDAQDVLLLAGGPDVRISIADPIKGLAAFKLPRSEYSAFDAALHKAADATTP